MVRQVGAKVAVNTVDSAPRAAVPTVVFSDPGDSGQAKRVVKGQTMRVELIVDDALWRLDNTSGPIGRVTNYGLVGGRHVFTLSTAEESVKPGRFTAVFQENPTARRPRLFVLVAEIVAPQKA